MAGDVVNIKVCNSLKLRSGLTGNYHAICHYSYNLPLNHKKTKPFCDISNRHVMIPNSFDNKRIFYSIFYFKFQSTRLTYNSRKIYSNHSIV